MNETPKPRWQTARRLLVTLAVFATAIALFYAEEDWRGKRAWEKCKSDFEAQGIVMDWNQLIPPPVADDLNFFKASPKIGYSFTHSRSDAEADFFAKQPRLLIASNISYSFPVFDTASNGPVTVAQLAVIRYGSAIPEIGGGNHLFRLNDSTAPAEIAKLMAGTMGETAEGSQGFKFSQRPLASLVPAQIIVQADGSPTIHDLEKFIGASTATNFGHLQIVTASDPARFQVQLVGVHLTSAGDFLKWSDRFEPDFTEIREALKRPYAQFDGDYSEPFHIYIPNFVTLRLLAQILAERTQCYLLLGQPEKALREITLMNDSRRIVEGAPTGKPMTLVSAMIDVAITSLYASTIAYGLERRAWPDTQLAVLQPQLAAINLGPTVVQGFLYDPVASCHSLEISRLPDIYRLASQHPVGWFKARLLDLVPRGWVYQNMVAIARLELPQSQEFDLSNDVFHPGAAKKFSHEVEKWNSRRFFTSSSFVALIGIPNFTKGSQNFARSQTLVNQAQIVCALERYHLVNGNYPETLAALQPQFIQTIPHDLIGGQPLHYRRTPNGQFLLYSIGWNETDDHGQTSTNRETGDWTWPYPTQ